MDAAEAWWHRTEALAMVAEENEARQAALRKRSIDAGTTSVQAAAPKSAPAGPVGVCLCLSESGVPTPAAQTIMQVSMIAKPTTNAQHWVYTSDEERVDIILGE